MKVMQLLIDPGVIATDIRDDDDEAVVDGSGHPRYRYQR